jgi:hypothetical protein
MSLAQTEVLGAFASKLAFQGAIANWLTVPVILKWLVVSATLGAAVTSGYMLTQPRPPAAPIRATAALHASTDSTPAGFVITHQQPQPVANPAGEIPAASGDALRVATSEPTQRQAASRVATANAAGKRDAVSAPAGNREPAVTENTIREEAALLERARRALAETPQRALQLVDEHAARFRSGQLAAERELIAVQSLVSLGRRAQAEQRAGQFYQSYASSLYQRRMRQVLGTPENAKSNAESPNKNSESHSEKD